MKGTFLGKETITADLPVWFRLPSVWVKNPQEFKLPRGHEYLRKGLEPLADRTFMTRDEFEAELKRVLAPEELRKHTEEAVRLLANSPSFGFSAAMGKGNDEPTREIKVPT